MEEYTGIVKLFAGTFAPRGWAFCHGQLLSTHSYGGLFSLIQNIYGGDGIDNFALPDLRGRMAIGAGAGGTLTPYTEGITGGDETIQLDKTNLPAHKHAVHLHANTANAAYSKPLVTSIIAAPGRPEGRAFENTFGYTDILPDVQLSDASLTMDETGEGKAFKIMQPYMALNYIICLDGIHPSRP